MTRDEFERFREWLDGTAAKVLLDRGPRYAADSDALSNFKEAAAQLKLTPLQVWMVYAFKHWTAVVSRVSDPTQSAPPGDDIYGNFRDLRNYLDLGAALLAEAQHDQIVIMSDPDMIDSPHDTATYPARKEGE